MSVESRDQSPDRILYTGRFCSSAIVVSPDAEQSVACLG